MGAVRTFIWYALTCIGWEVEKQSDGTLVATDLQGGRWRIGVGPA